MKRVFKFFCLFFITCIELPAQSFQLDTTFQPFFDIRDQRIPSINGIHERKDGRVYLIGNFQNSYNSKFYSGFVCYYRDGSLFTQTVSTSSTASHNTLIKISKNSFFRGTNGGGRIIDTLGNPINNNDWMFKYSKTVTCRTGTPYFYSDGSSLFANGSDNWGNACRIINPPDTIYPGRNIIKVSPEGLWDSTFNVTVSHAPRGFLEYDSTRILVYGFQDNFTHYDSSQISKGLCRIFLDGSLDTTFQPALGDPNPSGILRGAPYPRLVQKDGSFFLVGHFYLKGENQPFALAKLNANGSLDSTFLHFKSPEEPFLALGDRYGGVITIAPTPDGGYLVGGYFTKYQGHSVNSIVKIDSTGKIEPQYFTGSGPDSVDTFGGGVANIYTIVPSKLGGYYVGGRFLKWDDQPTQPIVRIIELPTGINKNQQSNASIALYPNPSSGQFTIESPLAIQQIKVFDLLGKQHFEQEGFNSKNVFSLDLSKSPNGVYLVSMILANGQAITKKFIKQ